MDASALERDAVQFARLAVQRDHEGRYSEAVFYYKVRTSTRLRPRHPIECWRNPRRRGGVLLGLSGLQAADARRFAACGGRGGMGSEHPVRCLLALMQPLM